MCKISVIIPVRNGAQTLNECLRSISKQNFSDYEVIIVNDGSTDNTQSIISQFAMNDRRFKCIEQSALGIVAALNKGIEISQGEYIARMDADDIMFNSRLSDQFVYLQRHPMVDLLASQVELFAEHTICAGYREYIRWQNTCLSREDIESDIYVESPIAHPSVMMKKKCVVALGGYRDGDFPEDYDMWLRMHKAGFHMVKLPKVLLKWREDKDRTSRTDPRYERGAFDRLRAHYLSQDKRIEGRPLVYWGAGRKTRQRSGILINLGFAPSAWIDIDVRKIGNCVQGANVNPPVWLKKPSTKSKPFILSYVSNHGARELIAQQLDHYGYERSKDYLMVG